jgi:hypothetical protein
MLRDKKLPRLMSGFVDGDDVEASCSGAAGVWVRGFWIESFGALWVSENLGDLGHA